MLELLIGQIPEAIFFSLFMIYAKGLKEKRVLFTILMIAEYLLLKYSFPYSWLFQIGYMITTFLTLKVLYKEKSQIIDLFILLISYIYIIVTSIASYVMINNYLIACIFNRLLLFIPILILRNKLTIIQNLYKKLWNRNSRNDMKIKSVTFRSVNIFIFNIIFYILNLCMIYAIYCNSIMK